MRHILLSFATKEYELPRGALERSAKRQGFTHHIQSTPEDLGADFFRSHKEHFKYARGFGFWCWKPYLILRTLRMMSADDCLMYCDSQCRLISRPEVLFNMSRKHDGIGIFHQKREGHKNSTWTKRDTFVIMGCDTPEYTQGDSLVAGINVWQRTKQSLQFVEEWAAGCDCFAAVSDSPSLSPNYEDFKDHRHDLSILSILAIKHRLFTMCDCCQYGEGYRCDECKYPQIVNIQRIVRPPWKRVPLRSEDENRRYYACAK